MWIVGSIRCFGGCEMLVKNVSVQEMKNALAILNGIYENNVEWNNFQIEGENIRFTLKVSNSKKKGHRLGRHGRKMISACWHVHGNFFDILLDINPKATIKSLNRTIDVNGGNWEDWNIGSVIYPMWYSNACEC